MFLLLISFSYTVVSQEIKKPNVIIVITDDQGYGDLACNGNPIIKTPALDKLYQQSIRLTDFHVSPTCAPSRSGLMTGRYANRVGVWHTVGGLSILRKDEVTMANVFQNSGYETAMFGKWHLGDKEGRYPKDKGFDEWYGIPRTTNESMFFDAIGYDESIVEPPYVMEGIKGKPAEKKELYDLEMRRKIDAVLTERSCEFIKRNANKKPFFLYVPLTQLHFPTLPHRDFEGISKQGDFADSLIEMDARVGQIIDAIDQNHLTDNTVFIFASDNGPEYRRPWRGSAGMWTGTYHTAMEGALRVPLIIRWPNKIPAGKVTNEMVHVVDLFPTLAQIANLETPKDRVIDGLDQSQFLLGKQEKSNREGFVYFIKTELRAAKWRDWKMHFVWEVEPNAGANHLETPYLFNIVQDPKEESDVNTTQGWVRGPIRKMVINFQNSLKEHPPIPPGAPDEFQPK